MKKAMYYETKDINKVKCTLCPHNCMIENSLTGVCGVRRNRDGDLYSLNYGKINALAIDPIEKKPLYHFYPGSKTLSISMSGCNLKCPYCQNSNISQVEKIEDIAGEELLPEDIVKIAKAKNIEIIAYTYTEPFVFYEFMLETSMFAKAQGLKNVVVTNGYVNEEPFLKLIKCIDAFNVDLKSFRNPTYENVFKGKLPYVLNTIELILKHKKWLEITTLLVTELNDTPEEIEDIAKYIFKLDKNIPWHISRYFPNYKMKEEATNLNTLYLARDIAKKIGLTNVYLGNIDEDSFSFCPRCGKEVVKRSGLKVNEINLKNNLCAFCGNKISGVF